ncbi:MAG TPA: nuclear transport factor 2 family protein [Solirubrobacteraceae bacterium]|jgi:ketosteroid isomerase-like protein|nr:nuclear transport factor 2 family protein [Solirubrobacteraceae bacterium]
MRRGFLLGIAAAIGVRSLMHRVLLWQFGRNVAALNAGDYRPLLANYAEDAVLHFNDGPHRWAGEHRGKDAIERFLQEFVGAGLKGELRQLWTAGPPWAMTMAVRFDDEASAGEERLYANRVAMVIRTRWGRIVEHQDFYEDSERIPAFERALQEHGIAPVAA